MGEATPDPTPPRGRVRLVAFDLDGTLTRGETVCETIARRLGHLRRARARGALRRAARPRLPSAPSRRARLDLPGVEAGKTARVPLVADARSRHAQGIRSFAALGRGDRDRFDRVGVRRPMARREAGRRPLCRDSLPRRRIRRTLLARGQGAWLEGLMAKLGVGRHETAAVGDSWTDTAMFDVTGHAFYVGAAPPPYPGLIHVPDGNIHDISRLITGDLRAAARRR